MAEVTFSGSELEITSSVGIVPKGTISRNRGCSMDALIVIFRDNLGNRIRGAARHKPRRRRDKNAADVWIGNDRSSNSYNSGRLRRRREVARERYADFGKNHCLNKKGL